MVFASRPAVCASLLALACATAASAQTAPAPPIRLTVSSSPFTRHADLLLAGAVLATSGTDAALERTWPGTIRGTSPTGRWTRAAKLVAFDLPVVVYATSLNHELGHIVRADEAGFDSDLQFTGTPWSWMPFELYALDPRIFDDMGSQVGGLEASLRLKDRAEETMVRAPRTPAGHALATVVSSLDLPLYALWNLNPDKFEPGLGFPDGDVGRFVALLVAQRRQRYSTGFDATRRAVRGRAMLNLIDLSLWTLSHGLVRDYVWHGGGSVPVRWVRIGGVELIPSVRYAATPIGPEYSVRSHVRVSGHTGTGYVRWSERVGDARQAGAGYRMSGWQVRGADATVALDGWSHTTAGAGLHAAAGLHVRDWPSPRAGLSVTAGAKSRGYLSGLPLDRGVYVEAGVVVRPW